MLKLMGKKIFTILSSKILFISKPMEKVLKHLKQDNKGMILFDLIV